MRKMDKAAAESWLAGLEAAAERDREEAGRIGSRPQVSIRIAASMIDAVLHDPVRSGALPSLRSADEAAVRETWLRLRTARR